MTETKKAAVSIELSTFEDQIFVHAVKSSTAGKILAKLSGTQFLSYQRCYCISVAALNEFIKKLKTGNISYFMNFTLRKQLENTRELRKKILERTYMPEATELRRSLLTPFIEKKDKNYILRSFNALQLKILFPAYDDYSIRKKLAQSLDKEALLYLLLQAKFAGIELYLSGSVRSDMLKWRENTPELSDNFSDYLLSLNFPQICFLCNPAGKAGLFIKGSHSSSTINKKFPFFKTQSYYSKIQKLSGSTWLELYNHGIQDVIKNITAPKSKNFIQYLADLGEQTKTYLSSQKYSVLKDCKLNLAEKGLSNKLYPHQRVAVKWLLDTPTAFLADDMGLGKTLSVLATFSELFAKKKIDFLLVLCPNSLVLNWQREIKNWLKNKELLNTPFNKSKRIDFLNKVKEKLIQPVGLVLNYEEARLDYVAAFLTEIISEKNVLICLDESQRIKNPQSKTFKALAKIALHCKRRILLSGTPAPRDFSDLWAQMYFLDGGERFGDNYFSWLQEVAELGSKWSRYTVKSYKPGAVKDYSLRFQELLLRRKKNEVINLPPKIFIRRDLKLSGDQLKRYDEIRKDLLVRLSNTDGETYAKEIDNILEEILRAVQVAVNPRIIDENWEGEPIKFLELDEIVNEVISQGEKIVIWSNFTQNIQELVKRYQQFKAVPFYGDISKQKRAEYVAAFQSVGKDTPQVIIAIPAAGGVGITLTAASTAVYLDKTWNAEHWLQSIDRLYRIGQKKSVNIISLNACPVDYIISANLKKKQDLLFQLMDRREFKVQNIRPDKQELMNALK